MLLANQSVASKLYDTFPSLAVLRRHLPPDTKLMDATAESLAKCAPPTATATAYHTSTHHALAPRSGARRSTYAQCTACAMQLTLPADVGVTACVGDGGGGGGAGGRFGFEINASSSKALHDSLQSMGDDIEPHVKAAVISLCTRPMKVRCVVTVILILISHSCHGPRHNTASSVNKLFADSCAAGSIFHRSHSERAVLCCAVPCCAVCCIVMFPTDRRVRLPGGL
jgi:hypothetical protein